MFVLVSGVGGGGPRGITLAWARCCACLVVLWLAHQEEEKWTG